VRANNKEEEKRSIPQKNDIKISDENESIN
jgi:hypothetical protein